MVFAGAKLIKKDKTEVDASEVIDKAEAIAVYFSAHWCPPCRGFTPKLKDFFEEVEDENVVIIFVSSDRSADEGWNYFSNDHGDYYMLPHGSEAGNQLAQSCGVRGIPSLCVVDKSGKMLHNDGRTDVMQGPPSKVAAAWKKM